MLRKTNRPLSSVLLRFVVGHAVVASLAAPFVGGAEAPAAEVVPTAHEAEVANHATSLGVGEASFYGRGDGFAGKRTANGEVFDPTELTAAHRTLPLGTVLKVTNLENLRSVIVRVNDRGPYARGRVLDLSYAAAKRLGMVHHGHAPVRIERLG